ncbi:hypothetical protein C8R43DRAFT_964097 [Mycena crocata]|nr:hypothetical protein C8R43DRAFT_964097 [Mycena crocata]
MSDHHSTPTPPLESFTSLASITYAEHEQSILRQLRHHRSINEEQFKQLTSQLIKAEADLQAERLARTAAQASLRTVRADFYEHERQMAAHKKQLKDGEYCSFGVQIFILNSSVTHQRGHPARITSSSSDGKVLKMEPPRKRIAIESFPERTVSAASGSYASTSEAWNEVNSELTMLRKSMVSWNCTACETTPGRIREIVLATCTHTFCRPCIDVLGLRTNDWKCPACDKPFSRKDIGHLTMQ